MVDWSTIPKIDAHIHLMPPDVIEANQGCGDKFADFGSVSDYRRLMERYHIKAAVIMPFNDPYMLSMDFNISSVHDNLLSMCTGGRLFCFADIDVRNSAAETLRELERVMQERALLGVKIHPSNIGYPVDGAYFRPIFAWAAANGVPVEIHSYPRSSIPDDVCSPLRLRRVLHEHPGLCMSIAHLGGFQHEELCGLDAYFNFSAVLPDLVERCGTEQANRILRAFGTDRLIFATDYPDSRCLRPAQIYDRYFELLGSMDFTQAEAERICRENIKNMLRCGTKDGIL